MPPLSAILAPLGRSATLEAPYMSLISGPSHKLPWWDGVEKGLPSHTAAWRRAWSRAWEKRAIRGANHASHSTAIAAIAGPAKLCSLSSPLPMGGLSVRCFGTLAIPLETSEDLAEEGQLLDADELWDLYGPDVLDGSEH